MFFTVLILLGVTILPIMLTEVYDETIRSVNENELWRTFLFSPLYGIIQTMEAAAAGAPTFPEFSFWLSMLWQWLLAAELIARSSAHVPYSWEESGVKKKPRLLRLKLAARVKARSEKGRAWLERNPFLWLASQDEESSPRNVWLFVAAILGLWLTGTVKFGMDMMAGEDTVIMMIFILHFPLLIWIAGEASRRFSEDRSNQTFETLLSTPLSARQIIRGQWLALFKQFAAPIAAVLVWELLMVIHGRNWHRDPGDPLCWPRMVLLAPDAVALGWTGMWLGLKSKGRIRAILGSLILVLFIPWLLTQMISTVMEPLLNSVMSGMFGMYSGYAQNVIDREYWENMAKLAPALLMDCVMVYWAMTRLPKNFRQLAVRR
jgi:hypothetical protein